MSDSSKQIGRIENYRGRLWIDRIDGEPRWAIGDEVHPTRWQAIPEELYQALKSYDEGPDDLVTTEPMDW